jgi:FtsP/CotA-like multicopper oxidase with cupredoxin domain
VIEPAGPERAPFDREHVILLSDHSHEAPETIFRHLKLMPEYYNREQQTLSGLLAGKDQPLAERLKWGGMRMEPTDIADVTGATYTYLVNGHGPQDNWTGLFTPGERVRLRIINASSMTTFNLRIPGLPMTVVQADGQDVHPVEVDEFQIGIAETYDALIIPPEDRAYTLVAESIDRSGMARATLAPRAGMTAEVPPLRARPLLSMDDMGMGAMGGDMGGMDMSMRNFAHAPQVKRGPGVQTLAPMPVDRTGDPGVGLAGVGHRVLTYRDLMALDRNPDIRAPSRSIEIHLTGNMERFMWSFDGQKFSEAKPVHFNFGERLRIVLVNDTMMNHPIHLHGMFSELEDPQGRFIARKHTINVQPAQRITYRVNADNPGRWAYHCHLLYHMEAGMMREVVVS